MNTAPSKNPLHRYIDTYIRFMNTIHLCSTLFAKAVLNPETLELDCRVSNAVLSDGKLQAIECCSASPSKIVQFYKSLETSQKNEAQVVSENLILGPSRLFDETENLFREFRKAQQPMKEGWLGLYNTVREPSMVDARPIVEESQGASASSSNGSKGTTHHSQEKDVQKPTLQTIIETVIGRKKSKKDYYPFPKANQKTGQALLINIVEFLHPQHETRLGAEKDTVHLETALEDLNFKVTVISWANATCEGIDDAIQDFKTDCEKNDSPSCIVALMSHGTVGDKPDSICSFDGMPKCCWEIVNQFNNTNFKAFIGKPKVFLFQFCRGKTPEQGQVLTPHSVADAISLSIFKELNVSCIPSWTDMLIWYSTMDDHQSFRCKENGGWFIQAIVNLFQNNAHEYHMTEMMDIVAESMKLFTTEIEKKHTKELIEVKQMCPYYNIGFNKKFYLAPPLLPHSTGR